MGMTFENLTMEELCELMCGQLEEDEENVDSDASISERTQNIRFLS